MKKFLKLLMMILFLFVSMLAKNIYKDNIASAITVSKNILLDIPVIKQLPECHNGCEATSLTMMLNYAGIKVDKATVVSKMKKDTTPIKRDSTGKIIEWGNPQIGFVGDITGKSPGYSIDPVALAPVIDYYLPGKTLDLTGCSYETLESTISSGRPVAVWITVYFNNPTFPHNWTSDGKVVKADFSQHAVLLTGMDEKSLYYNDPLSGAKNSKIDKTVFQSVWNKMGKKALSYNK